MNVISIILLVIVSFLLIFHVVSKYYLDSRKSKLIKAVFFAFLFLYTLINILSFDGGVKKTTAFIILHIVGFFILFVKEIYTTLSNKKESTNLSLTFSLVYMGLLVGAYSILYGFSYIQLIIFSLAAILFYASSYLIKREEDTKSLSIFFVYTLLISYLLSNAISPFFNEMIDKKAILILIGVSFYYLSNMFLLGNQVFNSKPKFQTKVVDLILDLIYYSSFVLISTSLIFAL